MSSSENLKNLLTMSKEMSEMVNVEMAGLNNNIDNLLISVPQEQKKQIERLKSVTHRVISLSKNGKSKEANELLKKYTNECKSN